MNFLISDAWAEAPAAAAGASQGIGLFGQLPSLLLMGLLFVAFYFILIRPQAKRAKEHKTMIAALAKGDEIMTSGGILGRITELGEVYVTVEIADGVQVKVQRPAIQAVMPKGTIKAV